MPKSLLEAMSCGLICIGTNVEGINEVISDGIDGFLANGTNAESIAIALNRAKMADFELISNCARKKIIDNYTISAVYKEENELFIKLNDELFSR
jgi:glycosyltransferase involved in cell wall biosynthesis